MGKSHTMSGWHVQVQLFLFALLLTAGMGMILSSELLFMPQVSVQEEGRALKAQIKGEHTDALIAEDWSDEASIC